MCKGHIPGQFMKGSIKLDALFFFNCHVVKRAPTKKSDSKSLPRSVLRTTAGFCSNLRENPQEKGIYFPEDKVDTISHREQNT